MSCKNNPKSLEPFKWNGSHAGVIVYIRPSLIEARYHVQYECSYCKAGMGDSIGILESELVSQGYDLNKLRKMRLSVVGLGRFAEDLK